MKIVFISNYLTHHQIPLCEMLYRKLNGEFQFIETEEMDEERKQMGWRLTGIYPFLCVITDKTALQRLVDSCEVLIIGTIIEKLSLTVRSEQNMATFVYSERRAKRSEWQLFSPRGRKMVYDAYGKYRFEHFYLLCAGAFVRKDYNCLGAFHGKCLRWGYFPETKCYGDFKAMVKNKKPNSILWAGRLIGLKHPDASILMAEKLKKEGIPFTLNIIGNGELENKLRSMIEDKQLDSDVHLLGGKTPEEVRNYMEQSEIFLFTSDRNEGWGAVLNEAMNSGCAVIACKKIGAAPYLIEDGNNGFVFSEKKWNQLYHIVKRVLTDPKLRKRIGENAYQTIRSNWNADIASDRLLQIINDISTGFEPKKRFSDGICSLDEFHLFR